MPYLGNVPAEAYTNTVKDSFNGDGSTTAFTLSQPSTTNNLRVVVENVIQDPTVAYSCSGTTLTFTSAPPSGTANIYAVHLGPATMTAVPPAEITSATNFTDGITVDKDGAAVITADRASSDGTIIDLQKSGATVGSIAASLGTIAVNGVGGGMLLTNAIEPTNGSATRTDASINLGSASYRFQNMFLSGGVKFNGPTELGSGAYFKGESTHGFRFNNNANTFNNFVIREDGTSWTRNGIYFGASSVSSPSSNNLLDDYEEGSWTPSVGGSATYNSQTGRYIKIGNQVTCWFNVYVSSIGTGSTNTVSGLPFTVSNISEFNANGNSLTYWANTVTACAYLSVKLSKNTAQFQFSNTTGATSTILTNPSIYQNGTDTYGTFTYLTT